ncbi:hypothetical protein FLL45_11540 [Aliikangiella marina]|uniref:Prokaryotic glutathione synthetase ATP-binding domain-containing protein n=1 Tax=Aliikangiella marina TaxID=1712262 RepID=A0A545TEE0_9GAMM|nr:hypothetical protein [Aliikangiella marina]TQV75541.1 hypothetical protein FLL45_11540 [Aliikangiella marina]
MKKCAILSMDNTQDFVIYDQLLEAPLADAGWQCETVSWRADVDWNEYTTAIIRSTWDYQDHADEFLEVLRKIDDSDTHLDNPLSIVEWNIDKRYLQELQAKGVAIVPTTWFGDYDLSKVLACFQQFNVEELVIKPCVSANADDTYRVRIDQLKDSSSMLAETFEQRNFMVQPFMSAIVEEGEYSLFYFDGQYSHAILKTPKSGDFRVQEEHGGRLKKIIPEPALLAAGDNTLKQIAQSLLYARLDFVRHNDEFVLIEAELIEPSLYFNLDEDAPGRFVKAMENRLQRLAVI